MGRVEDSFAQQGMMKTLGARLTHVGDGLVRIAATVSPATSQQHGAGHAGLTFSLADSAAGYAALTQMAPDMEVVTAEFRISLLAMARGEITAEGRVVRPGRRLIAVAADVWAADGTHVATALGTMVPVPKPAKTDT
ncbi:thioesterase [Jannaschia pagri]|uniref:Thioesterase n=1 Tax=Jannaschia pagri TaxID=2829797 RepID=A0ABQ4NIH8_9RHOB|nr:MULTISPECIES: PaaI family thioesterase [unclassified Jannaschia]GIT89684.1 thioesterase [Jannaschia sp. AI_61]GIT94208.1 thioesterase [Jannaschia sp. AI_62]